MPEVKLYLFGSPHFDVNGQPVKLELRKSLALLAYLAVQREALQRDFITNLLWPEEDSTRGRSHLRHVLSPLKMALPEGLLAADRERIGLHSDTAMWVDVIEFRQLVDSCGQHGHPESEICPTCQPLLSQAVGLYQSDFMAGFTLPDSPSFDEWQYFQVEGLRQLLDGALKKLVECLVLADRLDLAVQPARRRLVIDPLNEDAVCDLMRLYVWTRQRSLALRQFHECKEALSDQLGIDPQKTTLDLMIAIESGHAPARPTHPAWQLGTATDTADSIQNPQASLASTIVPKPKYNLPVQLTSFVGRKKEIDEIKALVRDHRLVTLTGSGGVGKTRLVLRVADEMLDDYPDGVCLVELAPLADAIMIPQTVIAALGQIEQPGKTPIAFLTDFLRPKQLLLILDNVEHLVDACAELAFMLLQNAPRLTVLATSREVMGVGGEFSYRVPPLAMPDLQRLPPLVELAQYDAVRLFVERAGVVNHGFALTQDNAAEVAQITQRLDGIPLAIELAAARVRLLSVEQIALRLDDVFRVLTGGSRTALPRHQTLQALIDWSYNLLSEAERGLLRGLSVFAGGWTLAAAEEVWKASQDVLDLLGKLADKSLIVTAPDRGGEMRYRLLETVRQYAREKLYEAKESQVFFDRHLDYYLELAEAVEPQLRTAVALQRLQMLDREVENLRSALSWALDEMGGLKIEAGLRLASTLLIFWHTQNYHNEGYAWLKKGLSAEAGVPSDTRVRARACFAAGHLVLPLGRRAEARQWLEESLAIYKNIDDPSGVVMAQSLLGEIYAWSGSFDEANELGAASMAACRKLNDPWLLAWVLCRYGTSLFYHGDHILARPLLEESLGIFERQGDPLQVGDHFIMLSTITRELGDFFDARGYATKALTAARAMQSKWTEANAWNNLGKADYMLGDYQQMQSDSMKSVILHREMVHPHLRSSLYSLGIAEINLAHSRQAALQFKEILKISSVSDNVVGSALLGMARVALQMNQARTGAQLLGAGNRLADVKIHPSSLEEQKEYERGLAEAKAQLDESEYEQAISAGHAMSQEEAVALALSVEITED